MNYVKKFMKIIFASTVSLAVLSVVVYFFDTKKETENSVKLIATPVVEDVGCDNSAKENATTSDTCIKNLKVKK